MLERLGPDQGPVEPGLPGPRGADVIEVLASGLDQPVGGPGDLNVGGRVEQQPQRRARLFDIAGNPVGDQALGGLGMNSVMNSSRWTGVMGMASSSRARSL